MTGLDAKFLYSETPTAHMHTVKVVVFDVSSVEGGFSFDSFVTMFGRLLDRLPPFRRRVVPVPWGLGHPVWVEDPDFDLRDHLRRYALEAPGDHRQLARVVAAFAGTPLRRDRPLWELLVVEGMAGGRMAVVVKIHHAVADGSAVVALLRNVVDGAADGAVPGAPDRGWRPEPIPSGARLLGSAARAQVVRVRGLPGLARQWTTQARASERRRRSLTPRPPLPMVHIPRTSFNVSLSAERTFAMTSLALEDLRLVRRATGTTLNDVYLAVCGGALRRYLADRGELPDRPLVASVPVSTDPDPARLSGNRVDNLYVSIGTDVADPVAPPAGDPCRGGGRQGRPRRARPRPAGPPGRRRPAPALRVGGPGLEPLPHRRPGAPAAERGAVQRAGTPGPHRLRAHRAGGAVLGGADPRGHRAEHHRLELRRPARGVAARLPDQRRRPLADRRRPPRLPGRAAPGGGGGLDGPAPVAGDRRGRGSPSDPGPDDPGPVGAVSPARRPSRAGRPASGGR